MQAMQWLRLALPTVLAVGALALLINEDSASADSETQQMLDRFTGHYELVSFIRFPEDGGEVDTNYEGRIMYDGNGNMSAIGMPRDLPARAARSEDTVRGGFAYYGTVSLDLDNGIIIHHVQGSPTRGSWDGEDNIRYFEWTDDGLLKLSMKDDGGRTTGTLTWRRLADPADT